MVRVIDAKDAILGRLCTTVAKSALLGDEIAIVNCESAVISGNKKVIENRWKEKMGWGQPSKGPFFPRMPDRYVRRVIRGMLPYKQPKGIAAFRRVQCYIGVPEQYKSATLEVIPTAALSNLNSIRFVTVNHICKFLGGKVQ